VNYKQWSLGLGVFSIALGLAEVLGARKIAAKLGAPEHGVLVRAFGLRELAAGAGLLAMPASSAPMWGRVAGDILDLAALGEAARRSPQNKAVWAALGFVLGAAAIDLVVARGLDRTTGKFIPART
jgi:hypothetical protein